MATAPAKMASATASNSNGVITAPPKGVVGGNRKKQKRRAKQAAKQAAHPTTSTTEGVDANIDYDEDPLGYGEDEYGYSDADADAYHDTYASRQPVQNGVHPPAPAPSRKRNKKKKAAGGGGAHGQGSYHPNSVSPMPHTTQSANSAHRVATNNQHSQQRSIWNTSTQQERTNIKNFWLSLTEDDRKALLKIEKEAVLKKMKQQQKSSCSCTVCGRKRTAIEEELEVLYEGYYEELEQYAHHDHPPLPSTDGMLAAPLQHRRPHPLATPPPPVPHLHRPHQVHEQLEEDEFSDEEDYSDDEEYSDDDLESEALPPRGPQGVPDFFNFGSHLTVKGILTPWPEQLRALLKLTSDNLLTVADDLLKNDGRKFIEMMEQLAERRMQRESRSQYEAENHSGYPPDDPAYGHEDALGAGDEFDDDEASYDSQEDYDDDLEDEDEMVGNLQMASGYAHTHGTDYRQGGLTEEQRMQEGRRMFQIFAARMFEQRVLTAYREKVAKERQEQLLQDLVNEEEREKAKEAKKQRDAQKKKDKKKQQQQAKAEEKARRDAEKAEEEARLRQLEEQKQEEQRRKKEEQRKKREEERRKLEEEKARKEAERARRQQEEQHRREEAERKARELRAAEKSRKDEQRRREKEEREAREKESKDRKSQDDKEKRERDSKAKAERNPKDQERSQPSSTQHASQSQPLQVTKRPSQVGMVAVPGLYPKQAPGSGVPSPHPTVATPAIPKAPTPARPRQASQQPSSSSSPRQVQSQPPNLPGKATSPGSNAAQQPPGKSILQKGLDQQASSQLPHPLPTTSPLHQHHQGLPPPGMSHPLHASPGAFGGPTPLGFPTFPNSHNLMMHGGMGPPHGPMPPFPQPGPPMGLSNRMGFNAGMNGINGMNGMPGPPPGMHPPLGRGFGFDLPGSNHPPPGFGLPHQLPAQTSPIGQPPPGPPGSESHRSAGALHSRHPSATERERFESTANQPIARPAPIQRPSSVKPPQDRRAAPSDIDDLSKHLGSSALLDDTDDMPLSADNRRHSGAPHGGRNVSGPVGMGPLGGFGAPGSAFGPPGSSWNTPSLPFGQSPTLGQPGWGSLPNPGPMGGWNAQMMNSLPGGVFNAAPHGNMHGPPAGMPHSRPRAIRIAICQACRQLSSRSDAAHEDGFHDLDVVMRQIELSRALPADMPAKLDEVIELCSAEGDSLNGGGELVLRKDPAAPADNAPASAYTVRWVSDQVSPENGVPFSGGAPGRGSLGEIGSPMPSKTSPIAAPGFGKAPPGARPIGDFGGAPGGHIPQHYGGR